VPAEPQELRVGSRVLVLDPHTVEAAQAKARRAGSAHNKARLTFVRSVLGSLARQYADAIGGSLAAEDLAELAEEIRTSRDARVAINLAWMPLTPQGLLEDLYSRPHRLAEAAPELSAGERALLARDRGAPWTQADVPLLDEAAELLGEDDAAQRVQAQAAAARRQEEIAYARAALKSSGAGGGLVHAELLAARFAESAPSSTTAERAAADRSWTYGHVVVDEAQELSPMAWRAVLRRVPTRSMTVVGDLAQASRGGTTSWGASLDQALRGAWRLSELTVNYRTPASVMALATEVAQASGHATSTVRSARDLPHAVRVSTPEAAEPAHGDALLAAAVRAVTAEVAELGGGRLAVICATDRRESLTSALGRAAADDEALASAMRGRPGDPLSAAVAIMDPLGSKGLEFDVVVLVEPAEIVDGHDGRGGRHSDLYVAMTRATRRLHVVAAGELPPALSEAQDRFGWSASRGGA
jgi:DNA helicase IV